MAKGKKTRTTKGRPPKDRATRSWRERLRANLPVIRFVGITGVSLLVLYYLLHVRAVETHFVDPYTGFVAACSRLALRALGVDAGGSGAFIASPEFAVEIKNVCNGLEVTAIYLATVLGFPSTLRSKLIGVAIGYPVVFLVNIIRIVVLFFLGFRIPEVFEAVHYYYAQAFVIIATIGVWLLWVSLFTSHEAKASTPVPG